MGVLSKDEIRRLIKEKSLISDYVDLETQLQPNGFDCTLRKVARIKGHGRLDFDNSERVIPDTEEVEFSDDWVFLEKGYYRAYINEVVRIPEDMMALARPRSSLIRAGANILTAVWDAGYIGRSEVGLVVYNEDGIWLKRNARIVQLVFFRLYSETEGYSGIYRGENI
ncbi:deoxyuridine 5'-triphosphate nucleotidohydrolase [Geoglobus sp.]